MRHVVTWLVVLLVGGVAVAAIVAAIAHDDEASPASPAGARSTVEVSLCDSSQLELSIRASGFGAHVAALRLSSAEPCDVGELHVAATVVDRNGKRARTKVAPPRKLTGEIRPGQEADLWLDPRPLHLFDPHTGENLTRRPPSPTQPPAPTPTP